MIGDTIYAVASPPGSSARGIVRLSGPEARAAAERVLLAALPEGRGAWESAVGVEGHAVPCLVLSMPGPGSYTGEDTVELHLPGSPLLLDELCTAFAPLARLATPGEFTRRAFENGRMDLAEAESVLALIHAADLEESRFALGVLRGGLAEAVDAVRHALQDGLALLEAGLDFAEGETGAVDAEQWLPFLRTARAKCDELLSGVPRTRVHGDVLLLGAANAGKSSLVNALLEAAGAGDPAAARDATAGSAEAIVAPHAGTTRDVLAFELAPGLRLLDGPGDLPELDSSTRAVDRQALDARDRRADAVAAVLEVVDLTAPRFSPPTGAPVLARVFTKCDRAPAPASPPADVPTFLVSSASRAGLPALLAFLLGHAGGDHVGLGARVHEALGTVRDAIDRALAAAATARPEELIALDLQDALRSLDEVHGRSSPEDLLDRVFAGFCLGK